MLDGAGMLDGQADWAAPPGTPLGAEPQPCSSWTNLRPPAWLVGPLLVQASLLGVPAPLHGACVLEIPLGSATDHLSPQLHSLASWAWPGSDSSRTDAPATTFPGAPDPWSRRFHDPCSPAVPGETAPPRTASFLVTVKDSRHFS